MTLANNITDEFEEGSIRDFFSLLKPRVMTLVVFTGIVGIFLAPGQINLFIALIATFCIALGSGAAGAINMWYERDIDAVMKRTKGRPLPAGRMHPNSAIEFAVISAFVSVLIMAVATNILAAFLLLVAILFYVFVYTIWLKPRTPQNIVIGGAAGAFPPIIGWAAVTGEISLHSIILFTIIFMWTPPHFWALALYKNEDYKAAGIPMLPVVAGREQTLKKIMTYSLALIFTSLLPYIAGFSSFTYTIAALLLGAKFLLDAYRLYSDYSDAKARKLFFYSILYLFLLFAIMMLDKLLK